jgi:hypothetical protein
MQLLTKPTDFEQSESLKLLLHGEFPSVAGNRFGRFMCFAGAFSKTHSVDAQRWWAKIADSIPFLPHLFLVFFC